MRRADLRPGLLLTHRCTYTRTRTKRNQTHPPHQKSENNTGRDAKALDLLDRMLQFNPAARPSAEEVRQKKSRADYPVCCVCCPPASVHPTRPIHQHQPHTQPQPPTRRSRTPSWSPSTRRTTSPPWGRTARPSPSTSSGSPWTGAGSRWVSVSVYVYIHVSCVRKGASRGSRANGGECGANPSHA